MKELVKAWKVSGRKAQVLETRLQQAVEVARRYRRDLLRLAEQNRSRKLRADELQEKLLQLLEQRSSEPAPPAELPPVPADGETVPAETVRQLFVRLREAHDLVAEFETLLEFREKQVHELLTRQAQGPVSEDWRVQTLQRELSEARHRIRLLTQELSQQQVTGAAGARVAELEQQLAELVARGDSALQSQLQQRDAQIAQLQDQVNVRLEELKKAVSTIHAARDRIKNLEQELETARQAAAQVDSGAEEAADLLREVTNLQDELARVQDENEDMSARKSEAERGARELEKRLHMLEEENTALKARPYSDPAQLEAAEKRLLALEQENATLRAQPPGGDPERTARLEAAVVDLRQKLQLAGSKYQEVKAALIEKHQQLVALQNRSLELEKSTEAIQHGGRTLEAALAESRKQNTVLQAQLEALRKAGPPAAAATPAGEPSEALASMETKLKEARRSAVRAQAEAGLKRKEMARLQEEVESLKAKVVALGGTL
ncbi:MAG: hypothetical protein KF760_14155 [Candidatus Eremiobacteraeota bacterium]|nr:hypothetical protein [Candidatus Eremiobacteraeota bacterium]MCW5870733.1 hypothetical protein [Candidatus Eremiobacteraeota bacterium]